LTNRRNHASLAPDTMHVGFFSECYRPIVNGVVASIDALRRGLDEAGVAVTTFTPRWPGFSDRSDAIVRLPSLPLPTRTGYRLCVPYVNRGDRARMHALDIVHAHSPFVTGWMAAHYARANDLPLVFTYHTRIDAYAHYAPFERTATRQAMIALTRRFANAADAVIVPTRAMETRLRELGVHATIAVVPSSIDVARFAAGERSRAVRSMLGANGDEPLVLAVGRLAREKNLELAIDALANTRGLRLAVVGDGPHRAALERRVAERGLAERVRFAGALDPAQLPDAYASSDALVFPSASETQGLVLVEALAAALPIVALDTPATRDVVGNCGLLVAASPAAIGGALERAVRTPRSSEATAAAFAGYGTALQTRRVLEVYHGLLGRRSAA
jgi:1,2-diacylglycerol 3-alpha-glucosyltransferase